MDTRWEIQGFVAAHIGLKLKFFFPLAAFGRFLCRCAMTSCTFLQPDLRDEKEHRCQALHLRFIVQSLLAADANALMAAILPEDRAEFLTRLNALRELEAGNPPSMGDSERIPMVSGADIRSVRCCQPALAFLDVSALAPSVAVSKRWRTRAVSDSVWRPLCASRWPSTRWLRADARSLYQRWDRLDRLAGMPTPRAWDPHDRDDAEWGLVANAAAEAAKYQVLVELRSGEQCVLDGLYDLRVVDVDDSYMLEVVLPESARSDYSIRLEEASLSLVIVRRRDGKCMSFGQNLVVERDREDFPLRATATAMIYPALKEAVDISFVDHFVVFQEPQFRDQAIWTGFSSIHTYGSFDGEILSVATALLVWDKLGVWM